MFGFVPCLLAALLFAVAPLPVYYDRYFIHESLFCAATFGLILSGWRAVDNALRSARPRSQAHALRSCLPARRPRSFTSSRWLSQQLCSGAGTCAARAVPNALASAKPMLAAASSRFCCSSPFCSPGSAETGKLCRALLHAAPNVLARAAGQGHEKPFWYFGRLLTGGWSGGLLVALACLGLFISI